MKPVSSGLWDNKFKRWSSGVTNCFKCWTSGSLLFTGTFCRVTFRAERQLKAPHLSEHKEPGSGFILTERQRTHPAEDGGWNMLIVTDGLRYSPSSCSVLRVCRLTFLETGAESGMAMFQLCFCFYLSYRSAVLPQPVKNPPALTPNLQSCSSLHNKHKAGWKQ